MRKYSARIGGAAALISLLLAADASQGKSYWIFFRDRPGALDPSSVFVDPHARERRRTRGMRGQAGEFDVPVSAEYKRQVLDIPSVSLRGESRWLNAVSVEADPSVVDAIERLSCVQSICPVRKFESNRRPDLRCSETFVNRSVRQRWMESGDVPEPFPAQPDPAVADPYWRMDRSWYGPSLNQVRMVHALETHFRGNHGAGVRIAVLDGGFQLNHEAFQGMDIIAQYDFINNDDYTGFDPAQDTAGQAHHGTACLSVIGGYSPGNLIGLAHEAAFILGKTEDDRSETPIEEDYWVRALEWAEALGADVLSSSLSYKDWYNPSDYDGLTAPTSRAATIAYELGMVLCTSAGNEGPEPMSLGVPADAEGLLAIGAVRYNGDLADFSSRGPTADGRIKPDVLAQGVRTCCVSPDTWNRYSFWNGTSLSCPVAAGCMALILAEHPDWGPDRIAEAVRETASRAERPDPDWGWGIINVEAAIQYPSIAGWVLDRNGEGQPGVQVQLFGENQILSVLTGENGYYIFPNLDESGFRIQVVWGEAEKSRIRTLVVPPSEEVDFRQGE